MHYYKRLIFIFICLLVACSQAEEEQAESVAELSEPALLEVQLYLHVHENDIVEEAISALDEAHSEWEISATIVPLEDLMPTLKHQIETNTMPDIIRIPGLFAQRWLTEDAFLNLGPYLRDSVLHPENFAPGPFKQFMRDSAIWGIPDTIAPDIIFYNKDMFDAAGLSYPTTNWTFEDMRVAAVLLTLDDQGRTPLDPDFNPNTIQQWGWDGSVSCLWKRHLVRGVDNDYCVNHACTRMDLTSPKAIEAIRWWVEFTREDQAVFWRSCSGGLTDLNDMPFARGKVAMGFNIYSLIGYLAAHSDINYDVTEPFLDTNNARYTLLNATGYMISADTEYPEQAWALIEAMLSEDFLAEAWAKPGYGVPALSTFVDLAINPERGPDNQVDILDVLAYSEVHKPYSSTALYAHEQSADLFMGIMNGSLDMEETLVQIETAVNTQLGIDPTNNNR